MAIKNFWPIFYKEKDVTCRSLIACAMGNDYWVNEQNKFSPAAADKIIEEGVGITELQ